MWCGVMEVIMHYSINVGEGRVWNWVRSLHEALLDSSLASRRLHLFLCLNRNFNE